MPRWTPDLPRFALLDGPSPLQPLERFSDALGGRAEIWIKREDLLPLAFGGNKLRNLEFLVGAAIAEDADTLVTAGRRWSNHCRLTAAAGARAGLAVHLVLSGPPAAVAGPNERLDEILGAAIHVAPTDARADRDALVTRVTADLRQAGRRPYVIDVGGSGVVGAVGSTLAGLEVADQAAAAGRLFASVVAPTATGGTQAGLLVGLALAGRSATAVRGIAVAHPAAQLGAGYGHPTPEAEAAMRLLARTEGILVDPIYTAKALAGLVAGVNLGVFDGQAVVFWHAGGTPGLFETLVD